MSTVAEAPSVRADRYIANSSVCLLPVLKMADEAAQTATAPPSKATEASAPSSTEPEAGQKHPLEHKWTLWFDNPKGSTRSQTWGTTLRAVYSFDTVEDFWWCVANACAPWPMKLASDIVGGCQHSIRHAIMA